MRSVVTFALLGFVVCACGSSVVTTDGSTSGGTTSGSTSGGTTTNTVGTIQTQVAPDKCIGVGSSGATNGSVVDIFDCDGTASQQWTYVNGTLKVLGMCLDLPSGNTTNGTLLQIWQCEGDTNQSWVISGNAIKFYNTNKCVDLPYSNTTAGTRLQIWDCEGDTNQSWNVPFTATTTGGSAPNQTTGGQVSTHAVMDSGTYAVSVVLDTGSQYTTCSLSNCQAIQSSPASYSWVANDSSDGGSAYSIAGSSMVAVTNGNQWIGGSTSATNGTTAQGCPEQLTYGVDLALSSSSFSGAWVFNFQAQACNGYSSVNCSCAYNIAATESSSSDGGQRLIIVEHNAIDEMISHVK